MILQKIVDNKIGKLNKIMNEIADLDKIKGKLALTGLILAFGSVVYNAVKPSQNSSNGKEVYENILNLRYDSSEKHFNVFDFEKYNLNN